MTAKKINIPKLEQYLVEKYGGLSKVRPTDIDDAIDYAYVMASRIFGKFWNRVDFNKKIPKKFNRHYIVDRKVKPKAFDDSFNYTLDLLIRGEWASRERIILNLSEFVWHEDTGHLEWVMEIGYYSDGVF